MNKELELEAEKYAKMMHENPVMKTFREYSKQDFIAGATSNAAKQYWYKEFEKQKLKFAIEQLNNALLKADSKDAIRVCILQIEELEQQLKKLENEK